MHIESRRYENKQPTSASYSVVETAIRDPLLSAKLTFMLGIVEELQPLLTQFQTDSPMLPFLGTALENLLRSLMNRIVKKEVMVAADSLLKLIKIDMDQPVNIVATPKIDFGFAMKNVLRKFPKLSDLTDLSSEGTAPLLGRTALKDRGTVAMEVQADEGIILSGSHVRADSRAWGKAFLMHSKL